jgi:hypothetical protein
MPAKNDPKGFYERLGVSPTATAAEIKAACRRLAKHLDPDVNADYNAAALFKSVSEAYAVLSNPKLRAEYDASWYMTEEHQKPARDMEPMEPICCAKCGKVAAQPRSIVFTRVTSFWMTWIRPTQGIFCSSCARKIAFKESLKSAILGWWGVPWGLIRTPASILTNAKGGEYSKDINDRLIWYNALALFSRGNYPLAYALADRVRTTGDADIAIEAVRLIDRLRSAGVPRAVLKDPWAWRPLDTLAHLATLAIVPGIAIGLVMSYHGAPPRREEAHKASPAALPAPQPQPTVPTNRSPAVDEAAKPSCNDNKCADWVPVTLPDQPFLKVARYMHDDGGSLSVICDTRQNLIRIMHQEPRANWTEGDTVNETTMDDDGFATTSKYGKALSRTAMLVANESTFDLFRMGQAKRFFTVTIGNYSRIYPTANFKHITDPVLRACGDRLE